MKPYAYDRRDEHGSIQLHHGEETPRVRADEKLITLYSAEQIADLVAENAALKQRYAYPPETQATDAYTSQLRNEARAEGAELCVQALVASGDDDFTDAPNICAELARQLREGKAGEVYGE